MSLFSMTFFMSLHCLPSVGRECVFGVDLIFEYIAKFWLRFLGKGDLIEGIKQGTKLAFDTDDKYTLALLRNP